MIFKRINDIAIEQIHARASQTTARTIFESEIIQRAQSIGMAFGIGKDQKQKRRHPGDQLQIEPDNFDDIQDCFFQNK